MTDFGTCIRLQDLPPEDVAEIQGFIKATGSPVAGVQAYIDALAKEREALREAVGEKLIAPRRELQALIDAGASADELLASPLVAKAVDDMAAVPRTDLQEDYGTDEYWAGREYATADGKKLLGRDMAADYLYREAQTLAWSDDGLIPEKIKSERKAIILLGAPASGKSTIGNAVARKNGAVIVDSDEAKKVIPEYAGGIGANAVHEESAELAADVFARSVKAGHNMVLPKVGSSAASIEAYVQMLKDNGYTVEAVHVDVPVNIAAQRMLGRFVKTGRIIPPQFLRDAVIKSAQSYEQVKSKGLFDGYAKIDNSPGLGEVRRTIDGDATIVPADAGTVGRRRTQGDAAGASQGLTLNQSGVPATKTDAFKKWFKDSKVVDDQGKPLVVYHGTNQEFEAFDPEAAAGAYEADQGKFFFTDTKSTAEFYASGDAQLSSQNRDGKAAKPRVIEAYLSMQNPRIEDVGENAIDWWDQQPDYMWRMNVEQQGHDGLIINGADGETVYVAASPTQIKSVNNVGTFDPEDPRILAQGNRGSITLSSAGVDSGETLIRLFASADLSTFLHEAGHYFLEVTANLAARPQAPQSLKDDMATINDFIGVKPGERPTREQHETFARAWEAYAMEGKAPSLALASAFARFKAWLTRIYRTMAGLNVQITPELRAVFDRMLASDAEIAAARAKQEMRPLFAEPPLGISRESFSVYQRMAQRGQEQAEQALLEKTMEKIRRETQAWFQAERKAMTAVVASELNKKPVYRLTEALANGVRIDGDEVSPVDDMRMDRKALQDMFGIGVFEEINRTKIGGKRAIYADNGKDPQEVADFFGFKSVTQMIEALQNVPKRLDAIRQETDARLDQQFGDPLNDGSIEELALEAIHSDQAMEAQVFEARTLAKQSGASVKGIKAATYRARAAEMIGQISAKEVLRPESFLAAERKAANEAQAAFARVANGFKEGDLAVALRAKERQILNGMLYREARDFAKTFAKARERMVSYDKKSVREKIGQGHIEQIDALLERFDFRVRSQKQVARAESLKAYVDRMTEEGREAELNIDERLLDEARKVHYSRLPVDELRGLLDTVENIDHMGRFKQKLINARRTRDLEESASRVAAQIKEAFGSGKDPSGYIRNAFNLMFTADTMMVTMDQGKEMGVVYDTLKADIDAGQAEEQRMSVEMAESLDKLFKAHYSNADLAAMKKEKAVAGANGREWAKLEILSVALNTGNADNFKRMIDPKAHEKNRLTTDQVDALLATLTEGDWRFVQDMWNMIDGYWGGLSAVHQRRTGIKPDKVPAALQVTAPAFVTGGYYPIKYDPGLSASAARDEASAWDKFLTSGHGATAAIKNGMTKQRQKNGAGRTLSFDLSVPLTHMRDTIRYIALSEAVDNTHRVLNHQGVRQAFLDAGRENDWKTLNLWLKDTARGPVFNTDALNTFARVVKNNFTMAKLAFNLKTVVLQVTGLGQAAVTVGKKNMLQGMLSYAKHPGIWSEIVEKSAFMAERKTSFQKDIYDITNDTKISGPLSSRWHKGKSFVSKLGFAPMVYTQFYVVDIPTWLAGYNAEIAKSGSEEKAIAFADRMVARSQGSGLYADRSSIERGTVSENVRQADFIRLFTTLGSYMMAKMNRGYLVGVKAKQDMSEAESVAAKAGVALNAAADLALLYFFEAAMMALIYSAMTDDDEPEDVARFILMEAAGATVGGIPLIRDAVSGMKGYDSGGVYGSVLGIPGKLMDQLAQGENDSALRRSLSDAVGVLTGLPTTQTMRTIEGLLSDDVPLSEMVMGRNPLAD